MSELRVFRIFAVLCCLLPGWSSLQAQDVSSPVEQLSAFVARTAQASGRFEQTVMSASGRKPQVSTGTFAFQRPGRFRWLYETPFPQLLVSDGVRLWSWDQDLNQATVRTLGDALGSTPVAILAGEGTLEQDFELQSEAADAGLQWVRATPLRPDSAFESMRLGFAQGMLREMELHDNFGQSTVIRFVELDVDEPVDPAQFSFVPPAGADVIDAD